MFNVDDANLRYLCTNYLKVNKIDIDSDLRNHCKTKEDLILCRYSGNLHFEKNGKIKIAKVIILASDFHLIRLYQAESFMIDGTFRVTPYPFTQLLIISAFDNQSKMNIPVSYILINSKVKMLILML